MKDFMQTKMSIFVFLTVFISSNIFSNNYKLQAIDICNQTQIDQVTQLFTTSTLQATLQPSLHNIKKWIKNNPVIVAMNDQGVIVAALMYFIANNVDLWIRGLVISKQDQNNELIEQMLQSLESISNIASININLVQNDFNFYAIFQILHYQQLHEFWHMHFHAHNKTIKNSQSRYNIRHIDAHNTQEVTKFAQLFKKDEVGIEYTHQTMHDFMTNYPNYKFLAAFNHQNIMCGGIIYQTLPDCWKRYVTSVHPNFRHQGIATALMQTLHELGQKEGIFDFTLAVDKTNYPAQQCFKKAGYVFTYSSYQMSKKMLSAN